MLIVHHLNNSRSQRVLWLLEELSVPYELKRYQRDPKTMLAPPALRSVHPLGKSPVIEDDGVVIAESGAIVEYLAERYGAEKLLPAPGTPEHRHARYFMHYAEGSLMPWLLLALVFGRMPKGPMPFFMRPPAKLIAQGALRGFVRPQLHVHLNFLESELAQRTWFAGENLTVADIQMSFPLEAAATRGGLDNRYPKLAAFLERIRNRPAYQTAITKGGPFQLS